MAKQKVKVGRQPKRATKKQSQSKALLGNLTWMDMFPYRPQYEFNGFRSAFGAICTISFMFFVWLNFVSEIQRYRESPPSIRNTNLRMSSYKDSRTIAVPQIGIEFRQDGYLPFYDDRYFRFQFLQGDSVRTGVPSLHDTGLRDCTINDPEERVVYPNVKCPISDMSLQGTENLEYFRFVKIVVEQCVNHTVWDTDRYVPDHGSTVADGTSLCADQAEIEDILKKGLIIFYFTESDTRTDLQRDFEYTFISRHRATLPSSVHISRFIDIKVKRLETTDRYYFDDSKIDPVFLQIQKESDTFSDLEEVIQACNPFDNCDRDPHLFRMSFFLRLYPLYERSIRSSPELYSMFTNFGGVTFFFLVAIGGTATFVNKKIFQQQTKGLDLRKLDNSQFDKFGNLIDKSFQMPRELQDMTAE